MRLTLLLALALALLLAAGPGCACGPAQTSPSLETPHVDGVLTLSPAPSWWDVDERGAVVSATQRADRFELSEAFLDGGSHRLFEKATAYGALQVEREPHHGAFILSGLNPERAPVLYTAFVRGRAPVELFRCADNHPAARFAVGAADGEGFWVALDADCSGATPGAMLVRVEVDESGLHVGAPVPFGGVAPQETRKLLLHPTERLAAVFDADTTRLVRFDALGAATDTASTPAVSARFASFLPDAPALFLEAREADGGARLTELRAATDGGVDQATSAFDVGAGRAVAVRGVGQRVVLLAQEAAGWSLLVRNGEQVTRSHWTGEPGAQVRVAVRADGGVTGVAGVVERGAGVALLRVSTASWSSP